MRRAIVPVFVALTLLLASVAFAADEAPLPAVGDQAPGFTLPVYNADAAKARNAGTMAYFEGSADPEAKVIVLSFMASWCKPCAKELPALQKLYEQKQAKGLRIIGVSIDDKPEGQQKLTELLAKNKVTFPVTRDQFALTAPRYLGVKVPLPSIFVMDRSGKIAFVGLGYTPKTFKAMLANVDALLAAPPAQPTVNGPSSPTTSATVTVRFSSTSSDVDHYLCSLDGGPQTTCTSPASVNAPDQGLHVYSVVAVDRAGNTSTAGTAYWYRDSVTPVPVSAPTIR
jgi:peroxiredoxin